MLYNVQLYILVHTSWSSFYYTVVIIAKNRFFVDYSENERTLWVVGGGNGSALNYVQVCTVLDVI